MTMSSSLTASKEISMSPFYCTAEYSVLMKFVKGE